MKNNYENQISNLNSKINKLLKEKNDLNYNMNILKQKTKENEQIQIKQLQKRIKEYEEKIKENKSKEINVYQKQINDLQNKNTDYEKKITNLTTQIELKKTEIIRITNKTNIIKENSELISENNRLKNEVNRLKSNKPKPSQNIVEEYNIKIKEIKNTLNTYEINNNQLKNENNKNRETIIKLNNLIGGLNTKIKQLLEENKILRDQKKNYINNNNSKNLFFLLIDSIINKKIKEYKCQLMINLMKENINNFSKYMINQRKSMRNSENIEGYEKVLSGESKKVIKKEDGIKSEITYKNKIIIHKELNDTLNEFITKGKDNFMFEELFDEDKINNNRKNGTKK